MAPVKCSRDPNRECITESTIGLKLDALAEKMDNMAGNVTTLTSSVHKLTTDVEVIKAGCEPCKKAVADLQAGGDRINLSSKSAGVILTALGVFAAGIIAAILGSSTSHLQNLGPQQATAQSQSHQPQDSQK